MDFKQKTLNVSDAILNLLAEQYLDIREEVLNLKTDTKRAFEKNAGDIKECFDELEADSKATINIMKTMLASITVQIEKIGKQTCKNENTHQPESTHSFSTQTKKKEVPMNQKEIPNKQKEEQKNKKEVPMKHKEETNKQNRHEKQIFIIII